MSLYPSRRVASQHVDDVDDIIDVIDDNDEGDDEDEKRVLAQGRQAPTKATHDQTAPPALMVSNNAAVTSSAPRPAAAPVNTVATALADAMKKIEAQQQVIARLGASRDEAINQSRQYQAEVVRMKAALDAVQTTSKETQRNANYLEELLGLAHVASTAAAGQRDSAAGLNDAPLDKARRLRESMRPVCVFQVTAAPSAAAAASFAVTTAASSATETDVLLRQVESLESALEASRRDNDKLADLYRDAQRREKEAANGGSASNGGITESKLAEELARVHEVLSESTATWDAKQRELQRLRTLMRFSVLRKENEHLQGAAQRADDLEIALAQQHRAVKEKQYEIERLERHIERLLAEGRERRAPTAELKRLRLLESHVLGIIAAQERDSVFAKGAHNSLASSSLAANFLGLPADALASSSSSSTSLRPQSAGRQPSHAAVVNGSPRATASGKEVSALMQQYRLKGLIPSHLLSTDHSNVTVVNAAKQVAPPPAPPVAQLSNTVAEQSAAQVDAKTKAAPNPQSTSSPATSTAPPPVAARAVVSQTAASTQQTPATTSSTAAVPTESAQSVGEERPMSDAETPFSVIAARMAKYLAKKEEEKRRKQEEALTASAAAQPAAALAQEPKSSSGGHKARLQNAFTAAAAGLPMTHRSGSGYTLNSTDRACDTALKRQYDELRTRLDAVHLQGVSTTAVLGASRPSSAPVARRPTSGHRRIY